MTRPLPHCSFCGVTEAAVLGAEDIRLIRDGEPDTDAPESESDDRRAAAAVG